MARNRLSRHRWALAAVLALALAGCGDQDVYGQLREGEANEMVAALRQADISAEKRQSGDGEWSISVAREDFADAVRVLDANGLPEEDFATLGEIFAKEGFVSSPVEERARLIYGLSQELGHTVSEIDGVVQARVHLAIPEADPLSDVAKPSSAAVFVKYQPGYDLPGLTGAIKSLVTNSIEGLSYDRVSVVMVESEPALGNAGALEGTGFPVFAVLLGTLGLAGLAAALFARRLWSRRRRAGLPEPAE